MFLSKPVHKTAEYLRDIWAAVTHKKALSPSKKHLDETMLAVGVASTIAGVVTLNLLEVAGSAVAVYEAGEDLQQAGHKWRLKHPGM